METYKANQPSSEKRMTALNLSAKHRGSKCDAKLMVDNQCYSLNITI